MQYSFSVRKQFGHFTQGLFEAKDDAEAKVVFARMVKEPCHECKAQVQSLTTMLKRSFVVPGEERNS